MAAQYDYLKEFIEKFEDKTKEIVFNDDTIVSIQKSISQWLKTKERFDKKLITIYNNFTLEEKKSLAISSNKGEKDLSYAGLNKIIKKYVSQKKHIKNLKDINEITQYFIKGYKLLHYIREILTDQEITYTILYQSKEELLEAHLTLQQLFPAISLTLSDYKIVNEETKLSNQMSLSLSNTAINKLINKLEKNENELNKIITSLDKPNLWDSLVNHQKKINIGNLGHAFEAYKVLRTIDKYKTINYIGNSNNYNTESLAEALIKESLRNGDKGWQIGDIGTEQLKAVYNSSANLIQISSIATTLKAVNEALDKKNENEMIKALTDIYVTNRESFNNNIDKKAEEIAISNINKNIKKLGLNVIQ